MLLLATLAFAAPLTQPASDDEPQWTVTVDPLTEALGFVHVQVEHTLGQRFSLYAGPSLKLFNSPLGIGIGPFRGYGAEAGVRAFFYGRAPRGTWVMVRGVLALVQYSDLLGDDPDWAQAAMVVCSWPEFCGADGSALGGYTSALVGYTGIVPVGHGGLVLSGGLGLSYFAYGPNLSGYDERGRPQTLGIHGFLPGAHTNIGWAF